MKQLALIIILLLAITATMDAHKTRRRGIKANPSITAVADTSTVRQRADTLDAGVDSMVRRSRYDKPLRSYVETLFVTNTLDRTLVAIELTLIYKDISQNEMHRVTRWLQCSIPPGATRMLTFSSWDRQQSYYYRHSRRPKRAQGSPYDIKTAVNRVVVSAK